MGCNRAPRMADTTGVIAYSPDEQTKPDLPPSVPDPAHNSRNALDWAGIYRGVLPCADCEGIKTEIRLFYDLSYVMTVVYLGRDDAVFVEEGSFAWDEAGLVITLGDTNGTNTPNRYHVGENILFKLDAEGRRIRGALEELYMLRKDLGQDGC